MSSFILLDTLKEEPDADSETLAAESPDSPKEEPDADPVRAKKIEFGTYLQSQMFELTIKLQECTTPEFGTDYLKYLVEDGPKPGFFTKYQGDWNIIIALMENVAETMKKLRADLYNE
jgi:hypothetical protein